MLNQSVALIFVQLISLMLPIVGLLLLKNNVSDDLFGVVLICLSIISYMQLLMDYSFSVIIPRYVEKLGLKKVIIYVSIFRFFTFVLFALLIVCVGVFLDEMFQYVLFSLILYSFSFVVQSQHLFMKSKVFGSFILWNSVGKLLCLALIVMLSELHSLNAFWYCWALSFAHFSIGLVTFYKLLTSEGLTLNCFHTSFENEKHEIIFFIRDGVYSFTSAVTSSLYNMSNIFLIGGLYGYSLAGAYGLVERYIKTISSLMSSITLVAYNRGASIGAAAKFLTFFIFIFMLLYVLFFNLTPIWDLLSVSSNPIDFRIFFLIVPVISFSYMLQLNYFYKRGDDSSVLVINISALVFYILWVINAAYQGNEYLGLLSWVSTEIFMFFVISITFLIKRYRA